MTKSLLSAWRTSPMLVRVAPFLIFVGLTACQGKFGEASRYWVYLAKTLAGAGMVWAVWPLVTEMRWKFSWDAAVVGLVVFVVWTGLDGLYPSADELFKKALCPILKPLGYGQWCAADPAPVAPWNPHMEFAPWLAWVFVLGRLLGSALVVPPLEETFYRSFLYRYLMKPEFETLPLNRFSWVPFLITAAIFGFAHHEWLAGIICAILYQWLVIRHNRLGEAMTAHAITNFLLGLWVIWKGAWHFW